MRDRENLKAWRRENYRLNRDKFRKKAKERYEQNREQVLAKQKEYADDNRDRERERSYNWRRDNPQKNMWAQAKKRAREKSLDFDITPDDIVLPDVCPYLGIQLKVNTKTGCFSFDSYSLDRIDINKGYVKGNVEVISNMANSMKRNATKEQLIVFATNVLEKFK